jgi:hypothetical protein
MTLLAGHDAMRRRAYLATLAATIGVAGCIGTDAPIESGPWADPAANPKKALLFSTADLDWTSEKIYWSSVFRVSDYISDPIDDYYLYYSEDHVYDSQIGLATAPSPTGPFTDQGPIYRDPESSSQTETPSVIYNSSTEKLHLYYHGSYTNTDGSDQSTALATSTDGVNWTKYGVVITVPPDAPGDGHTGYFRPRRLNGRWHGYHLVGGTTQPSFGWSWSDDGKTWTTDWLLSHGNDLLGREDRRIEWSHSNLYKWQGDTYWIGSIAPYGEPEENTPPRTISISRIEPESNYTWLAEKPTPLIIPTEPWETNTIRIPDIYLEGETLYVYYTVNSSIAVAEFDYPDLFASYQPKR